VNVVLVGDSTDVVPLETGVENFPREIPRVWGWNYPQSRRMVI